MFSYSGYILNHHNWIIDALLQKLVTRIEYQSEFEIILQNLKQSMVIVSHNPEEKDKNRRINKIEYVNDMFLVSF